MDHQVEHDPSDRDLANRWAAGDEQGYEQLVTRFAPMVHARCQRALGASDADDATQAVFLVLADKRAQAMASPALAAWLFTVADYVVLNALRDRKRRQHAEHSMPLRHEAEETAMDDLREHLDACLAELPTAERDAVRLHHLAGFTLAEIAAQSRQPLSTIHARVQRGLGRLRTRLARRGVAVTGLALLACFKAEAAEPVPLNLQYHLRDLNPAGRTGGATSLPSDRVHRWSHPRISLMTRIALTSAAAVLLSSTAYHFLAAGDQPATPPAPALVVTDPDLDPDKAAPFTVIRWNDGTRLVERLRTLPEAALLPPTAEPILAQIAAVQQAVLVIDSALGASPEARRLAYETQNELKHGTPAQIKARREELQRAMAAKPAVSPRLGDMLGCGWITVADHQDTLLATLHQDLCQPHFFFSITPDRLHIDSQRMTLTPLAGSDIAQVPESLLTSQDPSADLEMNVFRDRGLSEGTEPSGAMTLHLDPAGARFTSRFPWGLATPKEVAEELALPHVDRRRLDTIPADALIAAAAAVDATHSKDSPLWISTRSQIESVLKENSASDPTIRKYAMAFLDAMEHVDGHVLFWLQPGAPIPTMTVQADLSHAAIEAFITATGETPNADGVVLLPLGPITLQVGGKDGHLIATTRPDGLAGAVASGGFCQNPEIQQALTEMPMEGPLACVLLRPEAFAAHMSPFLEMALQPEDHQRLADYRQRLGASRSYGSFRFEIHPDGMHAEAHGLVALIAGLVVTAQMAKPEQLFKGVN